jgi:hypothetical protein
MKHNKISTSIDHKFNIDIDDGSFFSFDFKTIKKKISITTIHLFKKKNDGKPVPGLF